MSKITGGSLYDCVRKSTHRVFARKLVVRLLLTNLFLLFLGDFFSYIFLSFSPLPRFSFAKDKFESALTTREKLVIIKLDGA